MFFNAGQTEGAVGSVIPDKAPSAQAQPNRNLSPEQFGKKAGPAEGGAAEGAAGEAAAGGVAAEAAEVAPLLLL